MEWDLAAFTAPVVEAAEQHAHSGCEGGRCQPQLRDRADEETASFDALLLGSGHVFLQNATNKVLKYETLHVPSGLRVPEVHPHNELKEGAVWPAGPGEAVQIDVCHFDRSSPFGPAVGTGWKEACCFRFGQLSG